VKLVKKKKRTEEENRKKGMGRQFAYGTNCCGDVLLDHTRSALLCNV